MRYQENFTQPLVENWKEWFKKHMVNIKNITPLNNLRSEEFTSHTIPSHLKQNSSSDLWLKVLIKVESIRKDAFLKSNTYLIKVESLCIDLKTQGPIFFKEEGEQKKVVGIF